MTTELQDPRIIKSISYDQHEILRWIMQLYCPQGFDADFTYNKGFFYKKGIPQPLFKFDINPQAPDVIQADVCNLPLNSSCIKTGIFDPPFLPEGGTTYIMNERYTAFKNMDALFAMYTGAMLEFKRVFEKGGILVVKCQDTVSGGQNYFNSIFLYNKAREYGFEAIDKFVLLSNNRILSAGIKYGKQRHSRKYHCYFYVFRKRSRIRNGRVHHV